MGHAEFINTQKMKEIQRAKRRKKIKRNRKIDKGLGLIDLIICFGITVLFFSGHWSLGLFAACFLLLPSVIDNTIGAITRPAWTTIKGEQDCPYCNGKYFIHQGLKTYWLGWKECSCQPTRIFQQK